MHKDLTKPRIKQTYSKTAYESPIQILESTCDVKDALKQVAKDLNDQLETKTFSIIKEYGIVVDKDELIRALNYDREQYSKGYAEAIQTIREKCLEHQDFHKGEDVVFKGWISVVDLDEIISEVCK